MRLRTAWALAAVVTSMVVLIGVSPADAQQPAASSSDRDQGTASTPPPVAAGLLEQEELTGDWGGLRTRWKDKGVTAVVPGARLRIVF